jgi:hypothetical protein
MQHDQHQTTRLPSGSSVAVDDDELNILLDEALREALSEAGSNPMGICCTEDFAPAGVAL